MKKYLLAAIVAVVGTTSAHSADMAARPYTKATPINPGYNWSGFYIGAHGGYADDPVSATFSPALYTTTLVPAVVVNPVGTTPPFGLSAEPNGGFGGFQIGYNWQAVGSPWVFGIEADASFGRLRGEDAKPFTVIATIGGDNGDYTGVARLQQSIDAFGTLRGRLGYAANTLLIYASGGLAWAHTETRFGVDSVVFANPANYSAAQRAALSSGGNASTSDTHFGFAVGGGGEWAFAQNWSVKAEYLFLSFRNGGSMLSIPGGVANTSHFEMYTVKGGINYRF